MMIPATLIALLLLIPLELIILLVLVAIKKSRKKDFAVALPPLPKKIERYGWEDYLKLPSENRKKAPSARGVLLLVAFMGIALILLLGFSAFLFLGSFNDAQTAPVEEESREPQAGTQIPAASLHNFTLIPTLNLSRISQFSLSAGKVFSRSLLPYASAAVTLIVAVAGILIARRRRQLAVIRKAKKTVQRLAKSSAAAAQKSQRPSHEKQSPAASKEMRLPRRLPRRLPFALLGAIAFLWISGLVLLLLFSGWLPLSLLASLKAFVIVYRFYIIGGIIALAGVLLAIRMMRRQNSPS